MPSPERAAALAPFTAAAIAFGVYAGSAARTITWWDGSSYPLAAVTLGIPGSPGSLLLTLLGWVVSRIPIIQPDAFRLNLFAALLAAVLVGVVSRLGALLATPHGRPPGIAENLAGALAGLSFAFAYTPWTYAVQFTPYVLSALWTALIVAASLAWWQRPEGSSGRAQLFLLFLLFGLDVSVHRTNILLLPAALLWLAIRRPPARLRDGSVAAAGLALGLAFHLLLIPMAAHKPAFLVEDTSTWAGWWSYVSIGQKGGGFLVNVFPRKASLLSVQVADYLKFLGRNLSPMFFLPAILAALGLLATLPRHPRRTLGLLAFFVFAGPGAILYFNLPRDYMRPIDRHYLPSLVILAPWVAVGAAVLARRASNQRGRVVLLVGLALVMAAGPVAAWRANRAACDRARYRFAETFARDLLEPLPENAILLTNGDNDTFPLWYLQESEGVRRDVRVVNLPLSNTGSFVAQLRRDDPSFGHLLDGEPLRPVLVPQLAVADVVIRVEPRADLGLPLGVSPPESLSLHPSGLLFGQDRVVLDILRLVRWRRPVFLACTVSPTSLTWLWPYARLDGLSYRIIPSADSSVWDLDHLRHQLLERVSYAGISDRTITMDNDARVVCSNYLAALTTLASAEIDRGRIDDAKETLRVIRRRAPPARLGWDTGPGAAMLERIGGEAMEVEGGSSDARHR